MAKGEEVDLQIIKTLKRLVGREHPDTLTCIANLALRYKAQGRWREAEELEMEVIRARKHVQGEEHPDTLARLFPGSDDERPSAFVLDDFTIKIVRYLSIDPRIDYPVDANHVSTTR